jgi:hypothetical protein
MDQSPSSCGWARKVICKVVRMVCEKYNKLNVSPYESASIKGNSVRDENTVHTAFSELTILFFLSDRAALRCSHVLS